MKVDVCKSFEKDISKLKDKGIAIKTNTLIEFMEACNYLSDVPHLKKLKGHKNYYRVQVGEYRIGLKIENETLVLLRFMNRKEGYL